MMKWSGVSVLFSIWLVSCSTENPKLNGTPSKDSQNPTSNTSTAQKCSIPVGVYSLTTLRTACPVANASQTSLTLSCTGNETYEINSKGETIKLSKTDSELKSDDGGKFLWTGSTLESRSEGNCNQTYEGGSLYFKGTAGAVAVFSQAATGSPKAVYDSALGIKPDSDSPNPKPGLDF